jgi:hypothetical protein
LVGHPWIVRWHYCCRRQEFKEHAKPKTIGDWRRL